MEKKEKGSMKPDKTCHKPSNMGTESKKATIPGQMYVPKKSMNEKIENTNK